ncbi:sodium:calcium antiporter [Pontibacillus halophilus JSM 076056 = DSM 19796]|uniref:Sodium:calcium antiporter n=1 Tax=Pontibacillus halophilus JSM 076056 = DSM 19796 TaxID=1385510 RepID=A0A0A5GCN0_9BACI|nr:sodium:calcium antiporter [Pontibacillus halophilus]KGX90941.1 sodium:calcium antiporter [Pontibacillus halophilus JSM 076056 = DSM 19796]
MNAWAFIIFGISAVATYFIASRLAMYGDGISEKTKTSSAFIGFIIGIAISLPELTASVTSIAIDSPNLAIGNLLGSNLFNLLALAVLDIVFRRNQIMGQTDEGSKLYVFLVIFMTLIVIGGLSFSPSGQLFHIGYSSIVLVLVYVGGVKWINRRTEEQVKRKSRRNEKYGNYSYRTMLTRFILFAVLITMIGTSLTISADRIADITGLGTSFIGSFLVGASTSLPDAVSVLTAIKLRNYSMGVSSLLGSNAFNIMLLSFTDAIYLNNSLFNYASPSNLVTSSATVVVTLVLLYSITRKKRRSTLLYVTPPLLIVGIYIVSTWAVYMLKG